MCFRPKAIFKLTSMLVLMSAFFENVPSGLFDVIGVAGFGLYVMNYALLTFQRVRSDQIAYFAINGAAAIMVLVGLSSAFNLASAMIQVFWIAISAIAIFIRLRRPPQADVLLPQVRMPLSRYSTGIHISTSPRPVATSNRWS